MADEVSNKLLSGLNRIGLAMRSAAWGDATESGLTPTQSQILAFIAGRSAQNPRSGDAADALGITPQTASVAIAALVAKGLVQKVPDASDRRASSLKLRWRRGLRRNGRTSCSPPCRSWTRRSASCSCASSSS